MISKSTIKLIRSLEHKKYRLREQLFVAEGPKVVEELSKYHEPEMLITDPDDVRRASFLQHPQEVLALFRLPAQQYVRPENGLFLALDGVQDPGNLGTIIRLADWFGITTIYCSPDTADAFAPKVVQATMGSIARVNIIYINIPQLIADTTLPVYGTLLDGEPIGAAHLPQNAIIVMGNEGKGLSPQVRDLVTHRIRIPSFATGDTAESLNVAIATAITCYEFRVKGER